MQNPILKNLKDSKEWKKNVTNRWFKSQSFGKYYEDYKMTKPHQKVFQGYEMNRNDWKRDQMYVLIQKILLEFQRIKTEL